MPMETIYSYALLAIAVYISLGLMLVLALRKHEMIVQRQLALVVFKAVLLYILLAYYTLSVLRFYFFDDSLEHDFFPCYGRLIVDYIIFTGWMFSFILKAAHLFAMYNFQHLKLNANTNKSRLTLDSTGSSEFNPSKSLLSQLQASKEKHKNIENMDSKSMKLIDTLSMRVLNILFLILSLSSAMFYKLLGRSVVRPNLQTVTQADIPIMLFWVSLLNLVVIALIIVVDWKALNLDPQFAGCYTWDYLVLYGYAVGFTLLVPPFLIALRKVKDTLYIRVELTVSILVFFLAFIFYLSDAFLSEPYMSRYLPLAIAAFIINLAMTYFPCFVQIYRLTRPLEANCTTEYLDSVIAKPALRKRFLRLAAKQLVIENVYFIIDYQHMISGLEDVKDASTLFEKYVRNQAPFELNLPHRIVSPIIKANEEGELKLEHFTLVLKHVKDLLILNTLPTFINEESKAT